MYTCSCCDNPKTYKDLKSLYRHQRKHSASYTAPSERPRLSYQADAVKCENCQTSLTFEQFKAGKGGARFCSHSCRAQVVNSTRIKKAARVCGHCSGEISTKNAKLYCSSSCCIQARNDRADSEIVANQPVGEGRIRRYLLRVRGHQCEVCQNSTWNGEPIPLEMDHIDGDASRTVLSNVRLLCCNCHALTPTHRGKNRGHGRAERRARYKKQDER
jgi:hypothetical protein